MHYAGELIAFDRGAAARVVVLRPSWLCSDVIGQLLAPANLHREPALRRPRLSAADIDRITRAAVHFGPGPTGQTALADMLCELGLCFQIAAERGAGEAEADAEAGANGATHFCPALLGDVPQPPEGLLLRCERAAHRAEVRLLTPTVDDVLPQGFFARLQVRAAERHGGVGFEAGLWPGGLLLELDDASVIIEKLEPSLNDDRDGVDIVAFATAGAAGPDATCGVARELAATLVCDVAD